MRSEGQWGCEGAGGRAGGNHLPLLTHEKRCRRRRTRPRWQRGGAPSGRATGLIGGEACDGARRVQYALFAESPYKGACADQPAHPGTHHHTEGA